MLQLLLQYHLSNHKTDPDEVYRNQAALRNTRNEVHFYRQFKKLTGVTPAYYKQKNRDKSFYRFCLCLFI